MQKSTTFLGKHPCKASQCYFLSKLELFTKQKLGTTANGSPDKQTGHETEHQHSERVGEKHGSTGHISFSPSLEILIQPASPWGLKV